MNTNNYQLITNRQGQSFRSLPWLTAVLVRPVGYPHKKWYKERDEAVEAVRQYTRSYHCDRSSADNNHNWSSNVVKELERLKIERGWVFQILAASDQQAQAIYSQIEHMVVSI